VSFDGDDCAEQLVHGLLQRSEAPSEHCTIEYPHMVSNKQLRPALPSDPAPCTCSNQDIQKAQAIREALRRELLNRPEPQVSPYWAVGAD
jgi:hypothetical protein